MALLRFLTLLSVLGLIVGCGEPHADLSSPKTHRSGDITFDYPNNWRITDDLVMPEVHLLFVETPGNALVILQSYPIGEADDLTAFSKDFAETAATETPIGKMVGSTFAEMPDAGGYEWIAEDFNITVLGESVPHRRLYGTKKLGDRQAFLILQVATEDYQNAEAGFQLIRNSLRSNQKAELQKEM